MIYFAIEFKDKKFKDAYMTGDANARFNIRSLHFANKKVMLKYRWFDESDTLIYEVRSPYSAGIEIMQLISRLGLGSPVAGKVKGGVVKTGTTNIKDREGFISNFLSEDFLQDDYIAIPIVGKIETYGGPFFFYRKEEVIKDRYKLSTGSGAPFEQVILAPSKRTSQEQESRSREKKRLRNDDLLKNAPVLDTEPRFDIEDNNDNHRDDSITPDVQRRDVKDIDWKEKNSDIVLKTENNIQSSESQAQLRSVLSTDRLNNEELASTGPSFNKNVVNETHLSKGAPADVSVDDPRELASLPKDPQVQTAGIGGLSNNATAAAVLGAILTGAIAHSIEKKTVKEVKNTIDEQFSRKIRSQEVVPVLVSDDVTSEDVVSRVTPEDVRGQASTRWNIIRGASVFDLDR